MHQTPHQLGLANANYHSTYTCFPSGSLGPARRSTRHATWSIWGLGVGPWPVPSFMSSSPYTPYTPVAAVLGIVSPKFYGPNLWCEYDRL